VVVLSKSYRLPRKILSLSQRFIRLNKVRHDKEILPVGDSGGEIAFISTDDALRYMEEKRTFVLFRTNRYAKEFCESLMLAGIPYRNIKSTGSWTARFIKINNTFQAIINGEEQFHSGDAKQFFMAIPSKDFLRHGFKKYIKKYNQENITREQLYQAGVSNRIFHMNKTTLINILKITDRQREVLSRCGRRVEGVNIHVDTIHSAKGKEADVVFVCTDTLRFIEKNSDLEEERRVMYVAITRAKEKLYIMSSPFSQGDLFGDELTGIYYQTLVA
jgi:DNA helicase-2/ATP-dependent DNA helicase PcrA